MLGVAIPEQRLEEARRAEGDRAAQRSEQSRSRTDPAGDSEGEFAFAAGFTEGGAAFGVGWDEWDGDESEREEEDGTPRD